MTRRRSLTGSSMAALVAVLLLGASAVLANGESRPAATAGGEAGQTYLGAARGPGEGRLPGGGPPASTARFTLEFVEAELPDVFQALSMQSGVNIALSGSVQGKTTLRLRNVTLEQAMKIVTKLNGLDYAWVEAAYVVGTPEEVRAVRVSELRTSVVVLQNVQPEYAQEVLSKLTPDVTVSAQKGVRSVLLLGTEASLAKAERALAEIDVAPIATPPTTEVVAIRYLKAEQIADMLKRAAPEVTVQPGPQENTLAITADSQQWQVVRPLIAASDVAPGPAQATQAVYYPMHTSAETLKAAVTSLMPDLKVTLGGAVRGGAGAQAEVAPANALVLTGAPWTVEQGLSLLEQLDVPTPATTEVVAIRYLMAEQIADMINTNLPEVTVDPGPQENSLAITADSLQWMAVRSLIAASDAAPGPGQETQAIYNVKYMSADGLKDALSSLMPEVRVTLAPPSFTPVVQQATGGAGGTAQMLAAPQLAMGGGATGAAARAEVAPITALVLSGAPWPVERGLKLLAKLDAAPRQVHITAMVTEVSREEVTRLGIDWSGSGESAGLGGTGVPVTLGEALPDKALVTAVTSGLPIGRIDRSYLQWSASIRALEEKGRARVLSNPSVTVLDGRQTSLHTGETYYYEVAVAAATTGGIVKDIRTFDVGISLIVTPRVNDDNTVTLTISPKVAALAGTSEFALPVVTERSVVTSVRVQSGETAVIAGLVSDTEQLTVRKVPFLGDLPLAGELFKHRERRPSHREILVFVTPTILEV